LCPQRPIGANQNYVNGMLVVAVLLILYIIYKIILYDYGPTGFRVRFCWSSFARQRKQNYIVLQLLLLQVNPNLILIDNRDGHYYYYLFYGGRRHVYIYNTMHLFIMAHRGYSFCRDTTTDV